METPGCSSGPEGNEAAACCGGEEETVASSLNSLLAPVIIDADVSALTLEAMKNLFKALNELRIHPGPSRWKPLLKGEESVAACKVFLDRLVRRY